MSGINSDSGLAASEHKPEPTIDAGCEIEVDRSVSWTAHSAGFAPHRVRASKIKHDAIESSMIAIEANDTEIAECWIQVEIACRKILRTLDARRNAKDETKQE